MGKVSVVIIAKNEEEKISKAIKSAAWANEVIVIDDGSVDKTAAISRSLGAKVIKFKKKKRTFSDKRNFGLEKARGEWILYLDADERVMPELKKEILEIVKKPKYTAYAIPRKNIVLGRELKYGGFGKFDQVKRLFKKSKLEKWVGEVHEEPVFAGELGHLKNKLLHIKAQTLTEMIEKTNEWSEIEARLMFAAQHPSMNILRFISATLREFWFRFIRRGAFLDGSTGIIHGLYQVFSRFVSYAKLWEMQNARSHS